jgi:hypothetical protein
MKCSIKEEVKKSTDQQRQTVDCQCQYNSPSEEKAFGEIEFFSLNLRSGWIWRGSNKLRIFPLTYNSLFPEPSRFELLVGSSPYLGGERGRCCYTPSDTSPQWGQLDPCCCNYRICKQLEGTNTRRKLKEAQFTAVSNTEIRSKEILI